MSRGALPGEHYCAYHQGNHSHYAKENCSMCKLRKAAEMIIENYYYGNEYEYDCVIATRFIENLEKVLESIRK